MDLTINACLPQDHDRATLIGRVWLPSVNGPAVVRVTAEGVYDVSDLAPTVSALLERDRPAEAVRAHGGTRLGATDAILANSRWDARDPSLPWFLAPCDLQAIKAAGVTFVNSLLERVIEERAKGDASQAESVRASVVEILGNDLATLQPGSPEAQRIKEMLIAQGMWSQYLEVGIGPDAEVFTKTQPMASVGLGSEIGIHPKSEWNNPEPEVVLAVNSRGVVQGATLGNDVNLRDFEGRSALLLSKAKDNNASCSIGPFLRLFDESFTMDEVRRDEVAVTVAGEDGFVLNGTSAMSQISRDPLDLVAQTINGNHQYPDGFVLFLGTMFAPIQDRDAPGAGFTHHLGDSVSIGSPRLGTLINRINHSDKITPWTFGVTELVRNLAKRGLVERL
ncbi:fumarylacetoacetate hydrolase family protein [Azospirillum sp. SYSU D00513]|uniref:fumarylacetoacetate hydrolase family protein n=1 Tax=Azospirillum sp. SYSU D00513 TaxID=2812561 RepID=UPI001A974D1C|nr:fumarylacetoacetate hydrolase family protein [Azospirillum sp. SYSU D00513]